MMAFEIMEMIAAKHGINVSDLKGRSRLRKIVVARYEVAGLLREKGLELTTIGRLLGGRDHSTIVYGLRRYAGAALTPCPLAL